MPLLPDIAPVRAVRGMIYGMEEGFVGKTDVNEKFTDGKWENDPEKKSKAGRFASENLGLLGAAEKGQKIGTWGGAIAAGTIAASFLFTAYLPAAFAAGAVAGLFPIVMAGVLTAGTAWMGAVAGAFVMRHAAKPVGAVAGMAVGSVVGMYNGIFKRGAYKEPAKPDPEKAPAEAAPEAGIAPEVAPQPQQALPAPQQAPLSHGHQQADISALSRAIQQANAGLASGAIRPDMLLPADTPAEGVPGAEGSHVANLRQPAPQGPATRR